MADNLFSEDLAFSLAKFSSFEKGKEYFEDGSVEKIWKDGDSYKAVVRGNELYEVNLYFENEKLEYDCTCPYDFGGACKHVVAAILAFASDIKYAKPSPEDSSLKNDIEIKKLLKENNSNDLILFLEKILKKDPSLIEDLKIFLAGPKATPVSVSEYKERFIKELNKLDMREALKMWYQEGEDYDDYNSHYGGFSEGNSLSDTVSDFIGDGLQYEENNNLAEAIKIYQAIFDALDEKQNDLTGDLADLSDAFDRSKEEVIEQYLSALLKTGSKDLREIGINYLGSLFIKYSIFEDLILDGLKKINFDKQEVETLLVILNKEKSNDLSAAASSLLTLLYQTTGNWTEFENLSLRNLKKNPGLVLDLLKYYQGQNKKEEILKVADDVLSSFPKKDSFEYLYNGSEMNRKDLEIKIRKFIKNIYSLETEYSAFINNLEWIVLLTGSLKDYEELVKCYRSDEEKEEFLKKMKLYFEKIRDYANIFKIFRHENRKEDILRLIKNHYEAECFPEMVNFIQTDYPNECFFEYKKKIDGILLETDVRKYQEAVYHLIRMEKIGQEPEFLEYINLIKTSYRRRIRLMEELKTHGL